MLVIDVLLLVILIAALIAGIARGFFASIGALAGLVVGGIAVYWLAPLASQWFPWAQWRAIAVLALSGGLLVAGLGVGSAIGAAVRRGVDRAAPLRVLDRLIGGVAGVVIAALSLSLAGASISAAGIPTVSSAVASSRILTTINEVTPAPIASALSQLRSTVVNDGLPRVGVLLSPESVAPAQPVSLDDPALATAAASVARISGTAYSCGISLTGTGFVIAGDRVVTNAHVVAGVDRPIVALPGRDAREGRIVYFDPIGDLAVIAVDGLGARVLPLAATLSVGASAVVQGYPYGGPFTQSGAQVLSVGTVAVPDIYSDTSAPRSIYALAADVRPGDSGGPLLDAGGAVTGVVFARGENDASRGYAMTVDALAPVVQRAPGLSAPVSSGRCTG
ncbi:MAG: MarP family serine protease [Actinobacteria bacterium]|nr:MarP family serine protease [Actinomycetota bacterium]